jgi:hypothetical protein
MRTTIEKLNEVLGHELACSHTLRRAEAVCPRGIRQQQIAYVRESCDVNCVNLAAVVTNCGGLPNQVPNPRFTIRLMGETIGEILDLALSAQVHILGEIESLVDDHDLRGVRQELLAIRADHRLTSDLIQAQLESEESDDLSLTHGKSKNGAGENIAL